MVSNVMHHSIELDGSLVKPDSRRWHHSLGNALWHTVCPLLNLSPQKLPKLQ
jgi:hypothetical protein